MSNTSIVWYFGVRNSFLTIFFKITMVFMLQRAGAKRADSSAEISGRRSAEIMGQCYSKRTHRRTRRGKYDSYILFIYSVLTLLMMLVHFIHDMTLSKRPIF